MTALLPPDPTRDASYWLRGPNGRDTVASFRGGSWQELGHLSYYGARFMADRGYTLASPHPIPTAAQLDALHGLVETLQHKINIVSRYHKDIVSDESGAYSDAVLFEARDAAFPKPRGYGPDYERWQHRMAHLGALIRSGHYLEFAAAMMPAGWNVSIEQLSDKWVVTAVGPADYTGSAYQIEEACAPDEKPARTAAALRVRAAMMEDGE